MPAVLFAQRCFRGAGSVCLLAAHPGTKGAVRELFYPDSPEGRARAEKFARHENKPGRGVYDCIGRLQDGARSRRKDTVADRDQVVADLDLKNITQRRDAVLQCVKGLVLPPSEIRDSGFGLHLIWISRTPSRMMTAWRKPRRP